MIPHKLRQKDVLIWLWVVIGCRWGELESGATTIAFTPMHQHETDDITGHVQTPQSRGDRQAIELCFDYVDIDAAYKVLINYLNMLNSFCN